MAYLNANIPPIYCKVKTEYLYDMDMAKRGEEDCVIFGVASISGRALLFHILLPNGAVYFRLPISAFFQKHLQRTQVPDMSTDSLQLWDCFSYYPSIHCFDFLDGCRGKYLGKDKKFYHGEYLFTIDWAHPENNILNTEHCEIPQEHKCGHFLALITVIMLFSLTIVFFGMLVIILLKTIGLTIKSKIQSGMSKARIGLQKILTKCSMR